MFCNLKEPRVLAVTMLLIPLSLNFIRRASRDESQTRYSFVTECFFMIARILNLGLLRALTDYKGLMHDLSKSKDALAVLKSQHGLGAPPQLEQDIANAKKEIDRFSQQRFCYEAQILRDVPLLQQALSFYRLMLIVLVNLVGGDRIPLPAECLMEMANIALN